MLSRHCLVNSYSQVFFSNAVTENPMELISKASMQYPPVRSITFLPISFFEKHFFNNDDSEFIFLKFK